MLDELRKFREATPFQPFEIVLVDGRSFVVPHWDFIWIPPGKGAWAYVSDPKTGSADHVNVLIISSIRLAKAAPRRRRKAG